MTANTILLGTILIVLYSMALSLNSISKALNKANDLKEQELKHKARKK